MNKQEFLAELRKGLSGLPHEDIEERLNFYGEMIDDRMEEGLSEKEAVSAVGSVDEIVVQIMAEIPLAKRTKDRMKSKRRLKTWEIVLLVLGSPVWLSLVVAAVAVIFSLYVVLWSVIVSLWAVFGSVIGCTFGGVAAGVGFALGGHVLAGMAMIGAGFVCAGFSVFTFVGCKAATKGTLLLTKKMALSIKTCFVTKEEA